MELLLIGAVIGAVFGESKNLNGVRPSILRFLDPQPLARYCLSRGNPGVVRSDSLTRENRRIEGLTPLDPVFQAVTGYGHLVPF